MKEKKCPVIVSDCRYGMKRKVLVNRFGHGNVESDKLLLKLVLFHQIAVFYIRLKISIKLTWNYKTHPKITF